MIEIKNKDSMLLEYYIDYSSRTLYTLVLNDLINNGFTKFNSKHFGKPMFNVLNDEEKSFFINFDIDYDDAGFIYVSLYCKDEITGKDESLTDTFSDYNFKNDFDIDKYLKVICGFIEELTKDL